MADILFVGGASASGKTTLIPHLHKLLGSSWNIYDFDTVGVPHNADTVWRQKTTEQWLEKLLNQETKSCLVGQMVLGEILACPSAQKLEHVNFCLLDVADVERIRRLQSRNAGHADQVMLNWAAWLRAHHQLPWWEQHVIKDGAWKDLDFTRWDTLQTWHQKARVTLIDTTGQSPADVAGTLADLIHLQ